MWAAERALPSGILPEQVHPESGDFISVSPLTWSHATLVAAVLDYIEKAQALSGHESMPHQPWPVRIGGDGMSEQPYGDVIPPVFDEASRGQLLAFLMFSERDVELLREPG